jgi:integrase
VPTLKEFAPRFLEEHGRANRLKPTTQRDHEAILRVHLVPALGDKRLDAITTGDVQRLKASLSSRSAKTTNNVLVVLSVLLKAAVAWSVLEQMPCAIKLLRVPKPWTSFHDFEAFEALVAATVRDDQAHLVTLLGGEAGLRLGEILALEWRDIDLPKRQLCVARSEWRGQVTAPKGGRLRYVPLTKRLTDALRVARHLRGPRVLSTTDGQPLSQKAIEVKMRRAARQANVKAGVHILRHTFCSHLAMRGAPARAIQELAGHQDLSTTQRYMHLSPAAVENAIRLLETPGVLPGRGNIVATEEATISNSSL